ncbi:hypothetical protein ERJ75_001185500 [Trypanosoma vivax]|nr:hypothetical protein ERJ75_001185500 [Trypanosoma vivax]
MPEERCVFEGQWCEAEGEIQHSSGEAFPTTSTLVPIVSSEVRAQAAPRNAPAGEARPTETGGQAQLADGVVQGVCSVPPGNPQILRAKEEARSGNPEGRGVVLQCSTGQLLEGTLQASEAIRPHT